MRHALRDVHGRLRHEVLIVVLQVLATAIPEQVDLRGVVQLGFGGIRIRYVHVENGASGPFTAIGHARNIIVRVFDVLSILCVRARGESRIDTAVLKSNGGHLFIRLETQVVDG